ncbi:MAG: NAD(P)-binding domain-containing protein [Betaproteobacteria bacterium]|nr:NAD(P)-binding domain-containing protein [Betaproteobacteria bacterium]
MDTNDRIKQGRREFLQAAAASIALGGLPLAARAAGEKLKIGVIGSGRVGGTVGGLWVKAGHEVMFSSLDLEHDKALAARLGAGARAGTPKEAGAFGEVLFMAVPYAALPQLGRDLGDSLKGKTVLDSCNPIPGRDGDMALEAREKGTGVASPQFLPGARIVRAFNSVGYTRLQSEAHRAGERVAIPLAADDAAALQVAVRLVQDAGFEPVMVGPLSRAKEFDAGTAVFGKGLTAAELRKSLGINP